MYIKNKNQLIVSTANYDKMTSKMEHFKDDTLTVFRIAEPPSKGEKRCNFKSEMLTL
jgi:hypothetical protein